MPGRDGRTCSVLCYGCQAWGHYSDQCPAANTTGTSGTGLAQFGIVLNQGSEHIPSDWILLDTCSTNSVFSNSKFLKEIVACDKDENLTIFSNGGKQEYFLKSQMKLFLIAVH